MKSTATIVYLSELKLLEFNIFMPNWSNGVKISETEESVPLFPGLNAKFMT